MDVPGRAIFMFGTADAGVDMGAVHGVGEAAGSGIFMFGTPVCTVDAADPIRDSDVGDTGGITMFATGPDAIGARAATSAIRKLAASIADTGRIAMFATPVWTVGVAD